MYILGTTQLVAHIAGWVTGRKGFSDYHQDDEHHHQYDNDHRQHDAKVH